MGVGASFEKGVVLCLHIVGDSPLQPTVSQGTGIVSVSAVSLVRHNWGLKFKRSGS